jgi:plasmid maintenance system antidote protein VapI
VEEAHRSLLPASLSPQFLEHEGLEQLAKRGTVRITPETAWILASAFGQTPKYWLNLQAMHDLTRTRPVRPVARMPEALKAAG